jgi:hypothetical protein
VNTDERALELYRAQRRVLEIQTTLHRWARQPAGLVESPVSFAAHAGFGRRPGETHQWQHWQGAPGRPHYGE